MSLYPVPEGVYFGLWLFAVSTLVVWPVVDALRANRNIWALAIVLAAPFAGILWIGARRTLKQFPVRGAHAA